MLAKKLVVRTQNVHVDVIKSRDSENNNTDIILSTLLLLVPNGLLFLSLFSFMMWTMIKALLTNNW